MSASTPPAAISSTGGPPCSEQAPSPLQWGESLQRHRERVRTSLLSHLTDHVKLAHQELASASYAPQRDNLDMVSRAAVAHLQVQESAQQLRDAGARHRAAVGLAPTDAATAQGVDAPYGYPSATGVDQSAHRVRYVDQPGDLRTVGASVGIPSDTTIAASTALNEASRLIGAADTAATAARRARAACDSASRILRTDALQAVGAISDESVVALETWRTAVWRCSSCLALSANRSVCGLCGAPASTGVPLYAENAALKSAMACVPSVPSDVKLTSPRGFALASETLYELDVRLRLMQHTRRCAPPGSSRPASASASTLPLPDSFNAFADLLRSPRAFRTPPPIFPLDSCLEDHAAILPSVALAHVLDGSTSSLRDIDSSPPTVEVFSCQLSEQQPLPSSLDDSLARNGAAQQAIIDPSVQTTFLSGAASLRKE